MALVNLTPHAVTVIAEDGPVLANIPPSGTVARIAEQTSPATTEIGGIEMLASASIPATSAIGRAGWMSSTRSGR